MPRPTRASVTEVACTCGYLQRCADRSELPIVYDKAMNEFHFVWSSGNERNYLLIYHCPFCGGAAPQSNRTLLATGDYSE
jgi:hypothetical protein